MTIQTNRFRSAVNYAHPSEKVSVGVGRLSVPVFLFFLFIALPIQFDVGGVYMTGTRAILLVTTIPLSIMLFSGRFGRIIPTDVLLLIYSIWGVVTLFINSPGFAVGFGGSYILETYGAYLLARAFIRTPEDFRAMCRGLLVLLIFTIPLAIYESLTSTPLLLSLINDLPGVYTWGNYSNEAAGRRLGLERAQVIFSHPIHYGLFCASLISLVVVGFRDLIPTSQRYFLGFLVCVGVVCSVSSGALTPMVVQIGLIFWAWALRDVASRWLILTGVAVFCYVAIDLASNRTPIEVFLSYATFSSNTAFTRLYIFEWGMTNVWDNPVLGLGMNDWRRPHWLTGSVDNFWLLTAMRYGIPAFLLLASAYFLLVSAVIRRKFGSSGPVFHFRRAWIFAQVGLMVALCTVDIWAIAMSYVFFLFGSGAWLATFKTDAPPGSESDDRIAAPVNSPDRQYTRFAGPKVRRGMTDLARK